MDMRFSDADLAFRDEVRAFIADNFPPELKDRSLYSMTRDDLLAWQRICHEKKGWAAPTGPKESGGTGWSAVQKYNWNEENARAGTTPTNAFGILMLGPVLCAFGNEQQKEYFLPRILTGEHWWCQGYSEPGAGSDLAGLKTRAVREGDHYIVNGHKIWTTLAQHADWMFCLVRTDPEAKKQRGISFLLIDMTTPGVTVRPIITMDGAHEVNEVFLENVKVPVENLVGQENDGWTYAKFLLGNERSGIAGVARSREAIRKLKLMAEQESVDGEPLLETAGFSRKLAELEIKLDALEMTELRTLAAESQGRGPGPESSILKIEGTEIQQRVTELALEAVGHYGLVFTPPGPEAESPAIGPDYARGVAQRYMNMRKTSIYGGSNEIQRNIIAKMVLGL